MTIPTRTECIDLMVHADMPPHIQNHCFMVAQIALYLGRHLEKRRIRLNLQIIEAAALLHDIAKIRSLKTGEHHDELGARMLEEYGYPTIAPIVKEHVWLDISQVNGPITESLIVNYADKRVKHDQIVTIEDRFLDLMERYATTMLQRERMRERLLLYLRLEQKIFETLPIDPADDELMGLSIGSWGFEPVYAARGIRK